MKYYCDGWMMGSKNPSPYGGGFTVVDEDKVLIVREDIFKEVFTNNEAEIRGIKFALEYAEEGDSVSTDSLCCLSWVRKGRSKARPDLYVLLDQCNDLFNQKKINLLWEAREFNLAGIFNEENREYYKQLRMEDENEKHLKVLMETE